MLPCALITQRLKLAFVADVPTFELTGHGRCGVYHLEVAGHYAGAISVTGVSECHCEIGYEIEPEFRGRGIASEAVGAIAGGLDFALLSAQARADNLASRRVLEKAGFRLASSKLVWSYGEDAPLQIMAYHRLQAAPHQGDP